MFPLRALLQENDCDQNNPTTANSPTSTKDFTGSNANNDNGLTNRNGSDGSCWGWGGSTGVCWWHWLIALIIFLTFVLVLVLACVCYQRRKLGKRNVVVYASGGADLPLHQVYPPQTGVPVGQYYGGLQQTFPLQQQQFKQPLTGEYPTYKGAGADDQGQTVKY